MARIGLIVPADFVLDAECAAFLPAGASLHVTRLAPVDLPYDLEHAVALGEPGPLRAAAETFGPIRPAAVAFGCTMASFIDGVRGESAIRAAIASGGAPVALTTSGAFLAALDELGCRRVGLATPYPPRIAERFTAFMGEAGFEVAAQADRNLTDFERVVATPRDEMAALVERVSTPRVDAIFLAGTNTPAIDLLAWLSERAGRPVLSANQVTMWAAARAAGLDAGPLA
jgi:maleate isomerase